MGYQKSNKLLLGYSWKLACMFDPAEMLTLIVFLVALIPLILYSENQRRKNDRLRDRLRGLCPKCRYCLTGNVSGVCPECGTKIT